MLPIRYTNPKVDGLIDSMCFTIPHFKQGFVWACNYIGRIKWVPGELTKCMWHVSFMQQLPAGTSCKLHTDQFQQQYINESEEALSGCPVLPVKPPPVTSFDCDDVSGSIEVPHTNDFLPCL